MRNLLNFLIKYSVIFLFIALEIFSAFLMSKNESYQQSVFLSSSNVVVANIYELSNNVVEFFKLRSANNSLSEEITELKNQIIELESKLVSIQPAVKDNFVFRIPPEMEYRFVSAKVIGNSTNRLQNYITLNKGSSAGIRADMSVVSEKGVVGIVKITSEHFATVISLLNPKFPLSCKFEKNNYTGSLQWSGEDYRYANLTDIARHVAVSVGDTIVTSGLTFVFPEGIPVGVIEDFHIAESDPYYTIKVKLAVDFRTLSYVSVIDFKHFKEEQTLREESTQ